MITVKFNLHKPLSELEARKGRYSYATIAERSGLTRQGVRRLLKEETKQLSVDTLSALLTFFQGEGLQDIKIDDFFTVTKAGNE